MVDAKEHYRRIYARSHYSFITMAPLYDSAMTLIHLLRHPGTHDLFTRNCRLIYEHITDFTFAKLLLQALVPLAAKLSVDLPEASLEYFEGLGGPSNDGTDVAISYVLPQLLGTGEHEGEDSDGEDGDGLQLGQLLTKWNAMSLQ